MFGPLLHADTLWIAAFAARRPHDSCAAPGLTLQLSKMPRLMALRNAMEAEASITNARANKSVSMPISLSRYRVHPAFVSGTSMLRVRAS